MSKQQKIQQVISPDFVGTIEAEASDVAGQVQVALDVSGRVRSVVAVALTMSLKSRAGLREAVLEAGNRAEAARVMNELALAGVLDLDEASGGASDDSRPLAPLPGPVAPRLVVRTQAEQADHLARYINGGGLEHIEAPGLRRTTSGNGYLSLVRNERGQVTDVDADQEWLHAVDLGRLNNALKEAVES